MNPTDPEAIRLAHFSDVHVTAPACVWRTRDWFNKRFSAWVNLRVLGRGYTFRSTDRVLKVLVDDLRRRRYDRLLFSGDVSAMGFEEEVARGAYLLGVGQPDCPAGIAVPGNHDYCTHAAARSGHFERYFAAWQVGERVGDAVYPFAQRVGPAWLIALNSATANRWPWDASGAVGADQLARFEALLERLEGGPRILVTHYPVWLPGGRRERRTRALRDLEKVVAACQRGGISLWLHGHRHEAYHTISLDFVPFPVICAGSATQSGRWSYSDYTLTGYHLRVLLRVYDEAEDQFRDGTSFELDLPVVSVPPVPDERVVAPSAAPRLS